MIVVELITTSALFRALSDLQALTSTERDAIAGLEENIVSDEREPGKKTYWYQNDNLRQLDAIARKHRVFVFTKDLEGVLLTLSTSRSGKPLRAIDAILERIEDDSLPREFNEMESFLRDTTG